MKTRNLGTLWLMVWLCLGLLLTTGCGGGGGSGSLGTSPVTGGGGGGGATATTTIALDIDTSIPTAVKFSAGTETRALRLATPVNMFRIRVVDPATVEDLIVPVTVPRTAGTLKQRIFLRVPVQAILIVVEAFDTQGNAIAHATLPITPDPTTGQFVPIDISLTPGPLPPLTPAPTPTPTPTPTATPTPTPTPVPTTPSITTINPASGPLAGGTSVTITGTNFGTTANVSIGSQAAAVSAVTDTSITLTTPASATTGAQDVTVNVSAGQAVALNGFTYNGTPTIASVSPASGPQGGGTTLTISGTNLLGTLTVTVGGVPATVTGQTGGTTVTATTGAALTAGVPVDVVVNASASGSVTATAAYTYNAAPTITSVSPPEGGPLAGGTTVLIVGTNFGGTPAVTIGGTAATLVANTTTAITVTSPSSAVAGTVALVVNSPTNGTTTSSFTYNATPTISLVSPNTGDAAGGTPIVITGTGFVGAVGVTVGGVAAGSVNVTGTTQISAVTPAGVVGAQPVVVTAAAAGAASSTFTYFTPLNITTVTPSTGAPLAGGNTVVIDGAGFLGALTVTIGGNPATIVSNTTTSITVTAPAGAAAGAVNVDVTSSTNGSDTVVGGYVYNALPTIASVTPNNGPSAGGNSVIIVGTGFGGTVGVDFGANAAAVSVGGTTTITATAPAGATGTVTLTVSSTTNGVTTSSYTYNPPLTVTSVEPVAGGPLAGGNLITIGGTNFNGALTVTVGVTPATINSVTGNTTVDVFAPLAGASGPVTVTVTSDTNGSATGTYTYNDPPQVLTVTPNQGLDAGGAIVDIGGANFTGAITVTIGGANATVQSQTGSTTLTVVTPPGSGSANVAVTSDTRGTGTLVGGFTYLPLPSFTAVTPNNGPQVGGNTAVITGANFGGTVNVTFGANTATVVANDTGNITVTVPAAAAPGTVHIGITSSTNGFFEATNAYTYNPPLTLTAPILPNSGPLAGSASVTISGTNIFNVSEVSFGTGSGSNIATIGGIAVTVDSPAAAVAGQVTVTVTSTTHGSASLPFSFTNNPTLSFTGLAPVAQAGRAAAGDLNGDGRVDVVFANTGGDSIDVRLNGGGGVLGAAATNNVTASTGPADVVLADFDRDGFLDVATANAVGSVLVFFGDGTAVLTPTVEVTTSAAVDRITAADLDRDGDLDLLASGGPGGVHVVLNTGARTFGPSSLEAALGGAARVADFTRDGVPDLVTISPNVVQVLTGLGTGSFIPTTTVTITANPGDLAVGDFDGNGALDVAVSDSPASTISVLIGNGAGGLAPPVPVAATQPFTVSAADLNGDGVLDLAAVSSGSANVQAFEGTGTGTFYAGQTVATLGATGTTLVVADLTGDDRADLVASDLGGNVTVIGNGTAWLAPTTVAAETPIAVGAATAIATADLNRNGTDDLALAVESLTAVRTLGGTGGGGFATLNTPSVSTSPSSIAVGDWDRDGLPDLATADAVGGNVTILTDNGAGGYLAGVQVPVGSNPSRLAAGDMDNDGDLDLVVADAGGANNVFVLINTGGAFAVGANVPVGAVPGGLALADVDRNGTLDVAVSFAPNQLLFLSNDGAGVLSTPFPAITVGNGPAGVATADFNRDGFADVAVANTTDGTVTIVLGDGAGGGTPTPIAGLAGATDIAVADFTRDGLPDLAVNLSTADQTTVLIATGGGAFNPPATFAVGNQPRGLAVGDFNGDGFPDLAVGNELDATLSILLAR